jgi:Putative Sin3 binding protein
MAPKNYSAIGATFAGKSASVDIPKPRDGIAQAGRDSFAAVAANPPSKKKKQQGMLPTPPNSISPTLPPHLHPTKPSVHNLDSPPSGPTHIDSDIDLQDAVDHANSLGQPQHSSLNAEALDSLGDLDSAGAITPGMLAKHHLPDILLNHGPLAIRHVMGYLTTSVPGFSRISSAKARRLVVAALEGKGSGGEGAGRDGDVQFEKVGWGRWDARIRGQPPRDRQPTNISPPASMPSSYSQSAMHIPGPRSTPNATDRFGTSLAGSSAFFSHSEADEYDDVDMLENEADKMSLDGNDDGYASSSEAPEPLMDEDLGEGDVTDEEDWASMGAAALRARSLPPSGKVPSGGTHLYQPIADYPTTSRNRSRASGTPAFATSVSAKALPVHNTSGFPLPAGVQVNNSQEREAIEALLRLGSM